MKVLRFIASSFLLFGSIGFAQVRTWVSPDGLDTNPCTLQQPCRNFGAAIAAVDPGGEVVAAESAGYGPVTISKAVTVVAANGVHAAIAPTAGNGVTVAAGGTDRVILRNLYFNSQGADNGVDADTVELLSVENCTFNGFNDDGIRFDPSTSGARLHVSDTLLRRCGSSGIFISGRTATVDSVKFNHNRHGILAMAGAQAVIRNSVVSGRLTGLGFYAADAGTKLNIENSTASNNDVGFFADGNSVMAMTRCAATSNNTGIYAIGSTVYVSDSTIVANATGVQPDLFATILSRCTDKLTGTPPPPPCAAGHFTNTLQANTTNGAFNDTYYSD